VQKEKTNTAVIEGASTSNSPYWNLSQRYQQDWWNCNRFLPDGVMIHPVVGDIDQQF
jgi:hypothetical protein